MTGRALLTAAAAVLVAATAVAQPPDPGGNIPLPAPQLQQRLQHEPFAIVAVDDTEGGIMFTSRLELAFAAPPRIAAKWKEAPCDGESWNNAPRREVAAYVVQQLFLDPHDQVVPPVAIRCIPLPVYRPVDDDADPTRPPHPCVLGTLSAWLHGVTQPDDIFVPDRFRRDRRYAYHFANFNLLAVLITHRDRKDSNFLMATDALNPQVFSIDNGIAFGGVAYNVFIRHFDQLAVADLPRTSVERLRRVTPDQLAALGVLVELQPDDAGVLQAVPPGPNADPHAGVRPAGDGIQFGLTAEEIARIARQRQWLLERVDRGAVGLF